MSEQKIILAGSGHGAHAAYRSLTSFFSQIHLLSDDPSLIGSMRPGDSIIHDFSQSDARYAVCAGYRKIIKGDVLKEKTIINTHPSLLPKYRGMHSLVWAMLNGEDEFGFTIHLVNEFMDDGDIIFQHRVKNCGQNSKQVMDEFDKFVELRLGGIIIDFIKGRIKATPQDRSKATWVPRRNFDDCLLDFSMPNWRIQAMFRALVPPYPRPRLNILGKIYEITEYELLYVDYYTTLGAVVNIEKDAAFIKVKEGILIVKTLFDVISGSYLPAGKILKIGQRL